MLAPFHRILLAAIAAGLAVVQHRYDRRHSPTSFASRVILVGAIKSMEKFNRASPAFRCSDICRSSGRQACSALCPASERSDAAVAADEHWRLAPRHAALVQGVTARALVRGSKGVNKLAEHGGREVKKGDFDAAGRRIHNLFPYAPC